MAGIKDVAKEAGVGGGTVSRYLNDSGYVSEETRAKENLALIKFLTKTGTFIKLELQIVVSEKLSIFLF